MSFTKLLLKNLILELYLSYYSYEKLSKFGPVNTSTV